MDMLNRVVTLYSVIQPILDVGILAVLLYVVYGILVKTQAIQLLKGAISLLLIYAIAFVLRLNTLLWLLNVLAPGLLIGVAIVFQPELRKIFLRIGQSDWLRMGKRSKHSHLDSVLTAAEILSHRKRGMLAVFTRRNNLRDISDTGTRLNAELSSSLIVTVFGHDTPLHDGAIVIQGGRIVSAGCFLPLSEQQDIRKTFGTRHRAALGLSEETDAVVMIVSEETGAMSLAYDSKLYYDLTSAEVTKQLESLLDLGQESGGEESGHESAEFG